MTKSNAEQEVERLNAQVAHLTADLEAIRTGVSDAECPIGDTSDVVGLVGVLIDHHKSKEAHAAVLAEELEEAKFLRAWAESKLAYLTAREQQIKALRFSLLDEALRVEADVGLELDEKERYTLAGIANGLRTVLRRFDAILSPAGVQPTQETK